jgi:glycosyltransferase involved in cell wall biosynthesis
MPLVRVVIPTYNRAALVAEALESVLAQTFFDYEVVVADDGSSDETLAVLRQFSARDPRVRFLALSHGGAAKARNAAISLPGKYRYVAFLDADDLWVPDHLQRAVAALEDAPPSVGVFFAAYEKGDFTRVFAEVDVTTQIRKPLARTTYRMGTNLYLLSAANCLQGLLRSEFAPHPSTVLVRSKAVKTLEWFDPSFEIYEDLDFFFRLAAAGYDFIYDYTVHYYKRHFGDNLTGSTDLSSPDLARRYESVNKYHKAKLPLCKRAKDQKFVNAEIAGSLFIIAECHREQLGLKYAREAYLRSLQYRFTYRALRGLILSCFPSSVYCALLNAKSVARRTVSCKVGQ